MIFTWQINKQVKKIGWTIVQPYLEQKIQPRESLYQQLLKTPNLHPKKRYKILSAVYGHMQETFQSVKSVTEAERRWQEQDVGDFRWEVGSHLIDSSVL